MGIWIDGEKLEECPTCGKRLDQSEYDFQHCRTCEGSRAARYASVGHVDLCEMPSDVLHINPETCAVAVRQARRGDLKLASQGDASAVSPEQTN